MKRMAFVLIMLSLLSACEPSFKEEYEATKKELESTKAALAEAQDKLKAADNEIRHKIFTLIRRASNHLKSTDIEIDKLNQYAQELGVHIDSYAQLNEQPDHVSITAIFFTSKLDLINDLISQSRSIYNRRFNECLRGIGNEQQNKNELSNMLCEVQADVAKEEITKELEGSIYALQKITEEQLKAGRQSGSSNTQPKALEKEFQQLVSQQKESGS